MSNKDWNKPTTSDEAYRRASGRRHYNAVRKLRASFRRTQVVRLLRVYGLLDWGVQSRIAEQLGVSRATICRDIKAISEPLRRNARQN